MPPRRKRPPAPIEPMYYDVTHLVQPEHAPNPPMSQDDPSVPVLLAALTNGLTRTAACAKAGISPKLLRHWLRQDEDFAEQVERAEGMAEARATEMVSDAWGSDWKAAMAWLQKRRPKDWGSDQAAELASVTTLLAQQAGLTEEETREAIREAERLRHESWARGLRGSA